MIKKEKNNFCRKSRGITLIALVVTIIILVMLAGTTIAILIRDNGLLSKSNEAKLANNQAEERDLIAVAYNAAIIEKIGGKVTAEDLNTQFAINGTNATASEEDDTITVRFNNEAGRIYTISSTGTITGPITEDTTSLPTAEGTTPYFPSSNFRKVAGTSLSNGLVIRDTAGNEYVWVEVPNYYNEATAKWTGPDYSGVGSNADYDNIETALQNYASKYRSSYVDEWYDGEGKTAVNISSGEGSSSTSGSGSGSSSASGSESWSPISKNLEDTSGCGLTYAQYTTLKHKMLTSIYENGGFWIGRYEAGISEPRTAHYDVTTSTTIKALSQQNQYPLNNVYCSEAQILALKVATDAGLENYSTSLMFGIQWDLVMTYLEKKGTSYEELAGGDGVGSTNWGNYYNNLWTISNADAKYSTNHGSSWTSGAYGKKSSSKKILLSTGADESFSKMNIFDLAGNVYEWTLEYTLYPTNPCPMRGGVHYNYGDFSPASYRNYYDTGNSVSDFGFRVSLY